MTFIEFVPETNNKEIILNSTISYMLIHLGICHNMRGFKYLKYGIYLVYSDPNNYEYMTKQLYPAIAKHFNKTIISVERSIRYAIESMTTDNEIKKEIFGYCTDRYTNKEFISGVAEAIRRIAY